MGDQSGYRSHSFFARTDFWCDSTTYNFKCNCGIFRCVKQNINVTLIVEMKDKEFTSHKAKYALQFGTNNNIIELSLTFKSIKQKIQFSQHFQLISFWCFEKKIHILISTESHAAEKKGFSHKKTDPWGVRSTCQNLKNDF